MLDVDYRKRLCVKSLSQTASASVVSIGYVSWYVRVLAYALIRCVDRICR